MGDAPVVGWRLWTLRHGRLESWSADYRWGPGQNVSTCLAPPGEACTSAPGRYCYCGFWAMWDPVLCLALACVAQEPPWHVMGLIAGWGTVALHGEEGFRAEVAAVRCLFADRPWNGATKPGPFGGAGLRRHRRVSEAALERVAAHYAVPLLSLRSAVELGLLGELGVPAEQVRSAERLAAPPGG